MDINDNKNKTAVKGSTAELNGFYNETIKTQKKSFLSRVLLPVFIIFLCITLSASAVIITYYHITGKIKLGDFGTSPIDTATPEVNGKDGDKIPNGQQTEDPTDINIKDEIITTYKDITRVEVVPFHADASVAKAVEQILPSLVYVRTRLSKPEETVIQEVTALIISEDGYLITTDSAIAHLCEQDSVEFKENASIEVYLEYDYSVFVYAKVVGRDVNNNVALLKVESERNLHFIEFGDSDEVVLGELVMAATSGGRSAKGYVSAGIINAMYYTFYDKIVEQNDLFEDSIYMFSTSSVLDRSSNGGALINSNGQVIALISSGGSSDESSTLRTIPINKVKNSLEILEQEAYVDFERTNIGIAISSQMVSVDVYDNFNAAINMEEENINDINELFMQTYVGVKVEYVGYGTPAFYSGLKKNDIIINIFDKEFSSSEEFMAAKASIPLDDNIIMTVLRHNEETDQYRVLPVIVLQGAAR